MPCPHCAARLTTEQPRRTALGSRTFRCRACRRGFNERTGTPFNHLQDPTDVVLLVVLWRLRYQLRLRDVAELFLPRGVVFTHEAVRDWEARCAPLLAARLRAKRQGQVGRSWYVDETYVKVHGAWCSRYRAIDRDGNLVDARLSATGSDDHLVTVGRLGLKVLPIGSPSWSAVKMSALPRCRDGAGLTSHI